MKKSMAKVLASALSLAMAVTLVTPSNAAAASKPKFSKTYGNLYSNAVYTVKNVKKGYKVKVSVSGAAKSAVTPTKSGKKVTTIKATSSTVKFTAAVKASASTANKGATVTAVVYDKKGKKVKTLKDGIRIKAHATAVAVSAAKTKAAVNEQVALTSTLTPSYATDEVSYAVEPVSGAAISAGQFTATEVGTYKVTATANGRTSEPVEIVVTNGVTSATQTAANSIRVTFAADASKVVTKENLTVKAKDASATDIVVKEVKFAADGKTADVALLSNLKDGVTYDVSANGGTVELKASVGAVAKIAIETATAELNTETDIKFRLFDANGIDVTSTVNVDSTCFVNVDGENSNASTDNASKATITFDTVGKKATVKVTYNSGEKDAADVVQEQEIVCVDATAKIGAATFTVNKDTGLSIHSECAKFYLGLADTNVTVFKNGEVKDVYFYVKGDDGKAISYDSYEVESSNDNVATASAEVANGKFAKFNVSGTEKGAATLTVKAEKNGVASYYTIPVTVKEKGKAVKLTLTQTRSSMSNADDNDYFNEFEAKLYDADGNELGADDGASFEFTNSSDEAGKDDLDATPNGNKYKVFANNVKKSSSYTVKVKASDAEGTSLQRSQTFSVKTLPADDNTKKGEYKTVTYNVEVSNKTLDVNPQIKPSDRKVDTTIRLYATVNNLFAGYVGGYKHTDYDTNKTKNEITSNASELVPEAYLVHEAKAYVKFGQNYAPVATGDLVALDDSKNAKVATGNSINLVDQSKLVVKAERPNATRNEVNAFAWNSAFKATGSAISELGKAENAALNSAAGFARTGSYSVVVDVVYADDKDVPGTNGTKDHEKTYSTSFAVKNTTVLPTVSVSTTKYSSDIISETLTTNVDLNNNNSEYESIIENLYLDSSGKIAVEASNGNKIVKYVVVQDKYDDVVYNFLVPVGKTFVQK